MKHVSHCLFDPIGRHKTAICHYGRLTCCLAALLHFAALSSNAQKEPASGTSIRNRDVAATRISITDLYDITANLRTAISHDAVANNDSIRTCAGVRFYVDSTSHVSNLQYDGTPPQFFKDMIASLVQSTNGKWMINNREYILPIYYKLAVEKDPEMQHLYSGLSAGLEFRKDSGKVVTVEPSPSGRLMIRSLLECVVSFY